MHIACFFEFFLSTKDVDLYTIRSRIYIHFRGFVIPSMKYFDFSGIKSPRLDNILNLITFIIFGSLELAKIFTILGQWRSVMY